MNAEHTGMTPLFDLEAVGLGLTLTEAMKQGTQVVHQCAWCGCVVVWHEGAYRTALGLCPACNRDGGGNETGASSWWTSRLPQAGIQRLEATPIQSVGGARNQSEGKA